MGVPRKIFFSDECESAASRLGGYERIESCLDAIWDALIRNPYGFPQIESDWFSARYIVTKSFQGVPALLWIFTIGAEGEVVINHVEEYENY